MSTNNNSNHYTLPPLIEGNSLYKLSIQLNKSTFINTTKLKQNNISYYIQWWGYNNYHIFNNNNSNNNNILIYDIVIHLEQFINYLYDIPNHKLTIYLYNKHNINDLIGYVNIDLDYIIEQCNNVINNNDINIIYKTDCSITSIVGKKYIGSINIQFNLVDTNTNNQTHNNINNINNNNNNNNDSNNKKIDNIDTTINNIGNNDIAITNNDISILRSPIPLEPPNIQPTPNKNKINIVNQQQHTIQQLLQRAINLKYELDYAKYDTPISNIKHNNVLQHNNNALISPSIVSPVSCKYNNLNNEKLFDHLFLDQFNTVTTLQSQIQDNKHNTNNIQKSITNHTNNTEQLITIHLHIKNIVLQQSINHMYNNDNNDNNTNILQINGVFFDDQITRFTHNITYKQQSSHQITCNIYEQCIRLYSIRLMKLLNNSCCTIQLYNNNNICIGQCNINLNVLIDLINMQLSNNNKHNNNNNYTIDEIIEITDPNAHAPNVYIGNMNIIIGVTTDSNDSINLGNSIRQQINKINNTNTNTTTKTTTITTTTQNTSVDKQTTSTNDNINNQQKPISVQSRTPIKSSIRSPVSSSSIRSHTITSMSKSHSKSYQQQQQPRSPVRFTLHNNNHNKLNDMIDTEQRKYSVTSNISLAPTEISYNHINNNNNQQTDNDQLPDFISVVDQHGQQHNNHNNNNNNNNNNSNITTRNNSDYTLDNTNNTKRRTLRRISLSKHTQSQRVSSTYVTHSRQSLNSNIDSSNIQIQTDNTIQNQQIQQLEAKLTQLLESHNKLLQQNESVNRPQTQQNTTDTNDIQSIQHIVAKQSHHTQQQQPSPSSPSSTTTVDQSNILHNATSIKQRHRLDLDDADITDVSTYDHNKQVNIVDNIQQTTVISPRIDRSTVPSIAATAVGVTNAVTAANPATSIQSTANIDAQSILNEIKQLHNTVLNTIQQFTQQQNQQQQTQTQIDNTITTTQTDKQIETDTETYTQPQPQNDLTSDASVMTSSIRRVATTNQQDITTSPIQHQQQDRNVRCNKPHHDVYITIENLRSAVVDLNLPKKDCKQPNIHIDQHHYVVQKQQQQQSDISSNNASNVSTATQPTSTTQPTTPQLHTTSTSSSAAQPVLSNATSDITEHKYDKSILQQHQHQPQPITHNNNNTIHIRPSVFSSSITPPKSNTTGLPPLPNNNNNKNKNRTKHILQHQHQHHSTDGSDCDSDCDSDLDGNIDERLHSHINRRSSVLHDNDVNRAARIARILKSKI